MEEAAMRRVGMPTPRASFGDDLLGGNGLRPKAPQNLEHDDDRTLVEKTLQLLRRRWPVVLQALIVVPLATLVLSLAQQKEWTAESTLLFEPARQTSGSIDPARQAATAAKLVALPSIAENAARALGAGWTPEKVRKAVSVKADGNTDLIDVQATTASPRSAASVANAYASAVISAQDASSVAELQRRLAVYDSYVRSLPPEEQTGPRAERLQEKLDSLRISSALQSDAQRPSVTLRQRAQLPTSPSSPKTKRNVVLGVLLGGALGLALAALLDRLDRGIRSVDELERVYGLPVLGRIPKTRGLDQRLAVEGAGEVMRHGPEAEAFRALRANLRYFSVDGTLSSLVVVSPDAQDGKSTVAACLATTLAQRGDNVILVVTDLHKGPGPRAHGPLKPAAAMGPWGERPLGLSTVLTGGDLERALVTVPVLTPEGETHRLHVLPSGPPPPNPSELLESRQMRGLMAELAERYDVVVYDTPAIGAVADALPLLPEGAAVIVVSRLHHTSRDRAVELLQQLSLLRARVLGVVANYVPKTKQRGYDYYYRT
jgi:capsular exopolysaccharide synthesis family protein